MFTLGTAWYVTVAESGMDGYLSEAAESNVILRAHFSDAYSRLSDILMSLLGNPVDLGNVAPPGFHIFVMQGDGKVDDDSAERAHFDLQWSMIWPAVRPEATLSFTVLIDEPSGGASLEVWPLVFHRQCYSEI